MRNFLITLIVSSCLFGFSQNSKINWLTNFEKAAELSEVQNKPIMILFTGSDWCAPCKMLKKDFFESEKFLKLSDKFIMVMVDFPRNRDLVPLETKKSNAKLKSKYQISSLPTIISVNSKGKVIEKIKSYNAGRNTEYHFKFVNKTIKKFK